MSSEFEFDAWCKEYELNPDTCQALQELGYNSYRSLRHLDDQKIKTHFKKLLPAQQSLLLEGVTMLNPPPTPSETEKASTSRSPSGGSQADQVAESSTSQPARDQDLLKVLDKGGALNATQVLDLLRNNPSVAANFKPSSAAIPAMDLQDQGEPFLDPFQLGRSKFASKKRSVPEFVSSLTRGEENTTLSLGGVEFTTTANKKVSHEKLTMAQYMEGALRIVRAMVIEDGASLEQVMDYINYIIQVSVFGQTFAWSNVMQYDKVYRNEQAALGFRWGTASAFLMTSHLQKPQPTASGLVKKTGNKMQTAKDPKSGKIICHKFNGTNGCDLVVCNYAHVCKTCYGDHAEVSHKKNQPKN